VVFGDLEDKVQRYRERVKELGGEVSDGEEDEDEDGEEGEDGDGNVEGEEGDVSGVD